MDPDILEVEVKAKCTDFEIIMAKLENLGAKGLGSRIEVDTYYNHPSRDFGETDEAFRIRCHSGKSFITYKGPRISDKSKTRYEAETEIGSESLMREIILRLGFRETIRIKKHRVRYLYNDIEICLDEVQGLGKFVELEICSPDHLNAEKKLFDLASEFGLKDFITESYLELLKGVCETH